MGERFFLLRYSKSCGCCRRVARVNLIYPAPTGEPAIAGMGCKGTTAYVLLFESMTVNMGGPS
jgi:hypothetical protein